MILFDTCTFLWLSNPSNPLPASVLDRIRRTAPSERFISAISAFEIGYKAALGKLKLPLPPAVWFPKSCAMRGIVPLPLTDSIAMRASQLPLHHRDPADRFIISTALEMGLVILTPDPCFESYGVDLLWDP